MSPAHEEQPQPYDVHDPEVSHAVIELFGGDNNLSHFVLEDLREMAAGMTGAFSVLGLADFVDQGAAVIELSPSVGGRVLEYLGEIDTGDPETLAAFLSRALVSYSPGTHKALGFWDHGTGVFDEHDPDETILERSLRTVPRWRRSRSRPARRLFRPPGGPALDVHTRAMLHDDTNGGLLTNREARGVLAAAFARSGASHPLDLIFSDTCLNGMVEILEELGEFASVIVASEDLEPGDGWDYYEWFRRMSEDPPADGAAWGGQAVRAFEAGYSDRPDAYPCTLGAFRTDQAVTQRFAELVARCQGHGATGFAWLQAARSRSQSFAYHDTYDLRDFADKLKASSGDGEIGAACDALVAAFDAARVDAVALGPQVASSHGLAFWFPGNGYTFQQVADTYRGLGFDQATGWTAYLESQLFPE